MSRSKDVYHFVLVLSGVSEPDAELEDALFEAGCDDAFLAFRKGVGYLDFDRERPRRKSRSFRPSVASKAWNRG